MEKLNSIDLAYCEGLTKISEFSRIPNLGDLKVTGCENLVQVDPSVGSLKKLVNLDLSDNKKLTKFEIVGEMNSLKCLDLGRTSMKELPSPIRYLMNLEKLTLEICHKLTKVPWSIFELQHLQHLDLYWCNNLVTFPTKSEFSTNSNYDPLDP